MTDEKEEQKIAKLAEKKKTKQIIKLMEKAAPVVVIDALGELAKIADEDASNCITSYLDSEDKAIRVAACKAALVINTGYLQTQVRYVLNHEQDGEVRKQIIEALDEARNRPSL